MNESWSLNHKKCARNINKYWKARGKQANARVVITTTPVYFRYETKNRRHKLINLKTPDYVTMETVVSDVQYWWE